LVAFAQHAYLSGTIEVIEPNSVIENKSNKINATKNQIK